MSKQRIRTLERQLRRHREAVDYAVTWVCVVTPDTGQERDLIFNGLAIPDTEPGTPEREAVESRQASAEKWRKLARPNNGQ
ncbi:MAG: hypothetical protein H3C69_08745 [Candidatus Promineofilum sp.]|nr:hypothetical protein [Promineifilum sp.]